jgi:hypothetical protein
VIVMERPHIFVSGAFTGMLVAIFIIVVFVIAQIDPGSFAGLFGGFLLLASLSAVIVNKTMKRVGRTEVSLKVLIPIGFLTSITSVFGPVMGGPSLSVISYWASIPFFAALGGAFWSLPFSGVYSRLLQLVRTR